MKVKKNSNKISNDKYYTPKKLANYCWEVVDKVIGLKDIKYIIEPSVGNGAFCHYKRKPDVMIDIEPEIEGAIKENFIEWAKKQKYREKSMCISNVPFGERNHLAQMFVKYGLEICDYVAYILPINQLNNSYSFDRYGELIHSEELEETEYSGRKLKCCFNIYRKRTEKVNNKITSSDIKIIRHDWKGNVKSNDIKIQNCVAGGRHSKAYDEMEDYDIIFLYWGAGCINKTFAKGEKKDKVYAGEYKIKVDDRNKDKKEIIKFLRTYDWKGNCKSISMPRISKQDILNELNKRFNINQTRETTIFDYMKG